MKVRRISIQINPVRAYVLNGPYIRHDAPRGSASFDRLWNIIIDYGRKGWGTLRPLYSSPGVFVFDVKSKGEIRQIEWERGLGEVNNLRRYFSEKLSTV